MARWDAAREGFLGGLLAMGSEQRDKSADELTRAREILDEFGLATLRNERAGNLSGGQKRLVEFARIRMAQPQLVILDEPMGGVNPLLVERMALAIEGFIATGTSVIVVKHNLPFIERVTDHVVVMSQGSVIATGPFASLRSNQAVIDAYLGEMPTYEQPGACGARGAGGRGADRRLRRAAGRRKRQRQGAPRGDHRDRGAQRGRQVDAATRD